MLLGNDLETPQTNFFHYTDSLSAAGSPLHGAQGIPATGRTRADFDASFPYAPEILRAILEWRMNQADAAMHDFDAAIINTPEWTNPAWVRALYPSSVTQTVAALAVEHDRRAAEAKARKSAATSPTSH